MYRNYKADTVDQAIELGLEELRTTEEDVKINVLESGSKGFLGFGKKEAEVRLTVINPELKTYETIEALINRDHSKEEEFLVDKIPAHKEAVQEEETTEAIEEGPSAEAAEDNAADDAEEPVVEETVEDELSFEDAVKATTDYLHNVIKDMNIDNDATYTISSSHGYIELESALAAKLIGKRGQTLNALQEVGQNYLNTIYRSYGIIVLDIENYREKRRETLENLARNMSKKAIRTNQPVKLEPMPSFERKIMHNVLSDLEDISTHSEGSEPNRYLVIEKK